MIVRIFDTTLRDGEQSPGAAMTSDHRLRIALALDAARADVIEAGFPAASPALAASVREIAGRIRHARVAAFCRLNAADIDAAWNAIKDALRPRLFGCIPTSAEHIAVKLRATPADVLASIDAHVRRMAAYAPDVEFVAEDGSRTEPAFLLRAFETAIAAGATTVCLPDTVGYAQPAEFGALVRDVRAALPAHVTLAVHCHDDLGLAVANTLEAVRQGAGEVQVTVNGIGERAGNCALEEVVTALRVRSAYYKVTAAFRTEHVAELSQLVADAADMPVAKNKAIVGKHAFLHESGIHQDGVIKRRSLYEVIPAEIVGRTSGQLSLGRNSGRSGLRARCASLGIALTPKQLDRAYRAFIEAVDGARGIDDARLVQLLRSIADEPVEAGR